MLHCGIIVKVSRGLAVGVDEMSFTYAPRVAVKKLTIVSLRTRMMNDKCVSKEAEFSHGICPECARELYPEYFSDETSA